MEIRQLLLNEWAIEVNREDKNFLELMKVEMQCTES